MFKERINALKFDSITKTIIIPILIVVVSNILIAGIAGELVNLVVSTQNPMGLGGLLAMMINVFASIGLIIFISKIKLKDLGIVSKKCIRNILSGAILGIIVLSIVGIIIYLLGGVTINYNFKSSYFMPILIGVVFFSFQGFSEELIFRGYLLTHFSKKMNIYLSIFISSIFFTSIHALNPGMTIMPIVNLMVFSVVFSLVYIVTGNLFFTGLFHSLWNFTQGIIFGALVSGVDIETTVFKSLPVANKTIISGGNFGFEGSIVTTIMGIIIILILIIIANKKSAFSKN